MDSYKTSYATYKMATRIARRGKGIVYKTSKSGPYKLTSKRPPLNPYNRAKEKKKVRRLVTSYVISLR